METDDDLRWLQEHKVMLTKLGEDSDKLAALEDELKRPRWRRAVDPESGYAYWYNTKTRESVWEHHAQQDGDDGCCQRLIRILLRRSRSSNSKETAYALLHT